MPPLLRHTTFRYSRLQILDLPGNWRRWIWRRRCVAVPCTWHRRYWGLVFCCWKLMNFFILWLDSKSTTRKQIYGQLAPFCTRWWWGSRRSKQLITSTCSVKSSPLLPFSFLTRNQRCHRVWTSSMPNSIPSNSRCTTPPPSTTLGEWRHRPTLLQPMLRPSLVYFLLHSKLKTKFATFQCLEGEERFLVEWFPPPLLHGAWSLWYARYYAKIPICDLVSTPSSVILVFVEICRPPP